ncbi:MAG: DUF3427 domain-containing protein [Chlorobiaceae bacterium]
MAVIGDITTVINGMRQGLPVGIYDLLSTPQLRKRLEQAGLLERAEWSAFEPEELKYRMALPLAREIAGFISDVVAGKNAEALEAALHDALESPEIMSSIIKAISPLSAKSLQQILPPAPLIVSKVRPDTPLSVSALLTGSSRSPALRTQIVKELASCDRADWLVSFIKYAGILPLLPALQKFTQISNSNGSPRLRVATTSYMGATDIKAVKALLGLPNTEVRISYDTKRTRLHAKAYLFHRETGFGSAYIGSANISKAALDEGLEWTAKVSQYETEHLWKHAIATFESHWEDESEFTRCEPGDLSRLEQALSSERGEGTTEEAISFFDLRPYGYQQAILDDITAERESGKHKHLVIAATGTGKTIIAAFDYKRFCSDHRGHPRLLYVAHREEILSQARFAFRQVLRDGSFGDLVVGGRQITQTDHLFCTVQSWKNRDFEKLAPSHFEYIVLDEAHHASADSYQKLIGHILPLSLLGLTATPERSDGEDIRKDFGGAFTHEIRLPEAVERALLTPFHYYGIPDLAGLDFSALAWRRGSYDTTELRNQLEGNATRAMWVMSQTERYVTDMKQVKGLGFCVSVRHAEFMAKFCNEHNIPAIALSGESDKEARSRAQRQLEIGEVSFIFSVDLYNEGVDIPCLDTVLFLRPTESLTLFLQQLGRGLRLHEEKSHLTVLDFIAPQHRNFSFARRFTALTSRPELRIDKQIEADMPYLPAGCFMHLEKQAKEHVLENIRSATASLRGSRLLSELHLLRQEIKRELTLSDMLEFLRLDTPDELYRRGLPHQLLAEAEGNLACDDLLNMNDQLAKGFRRLLLMDDPYLIQDARDLLSSGVSSSAMTKILIHSVLWGGDKPDEGTLEQAHDFFSSRSGLLHDLSELFDWLLENRTPLIKKQFAHQTGPLILHASYTREQITHALGLGTFQNPKPSREGILEVPDRKLDIFFADINKSEADFSPTTMYEDYAITDRRFHWQSQSKTTESSAVGQRYIYHKERGYTPILFIRDRKKLSNGLTAPYFFAGPLQYLKHEGSKPISFIWELDYPLPAKALSWARIAG